MNHPALSDDAGMLVTGNYLAVPHPRASGPPMWNGNLLDQATLTSAGQLDLLMFCIDATQVDVGGYGNADVSNTWHYPRPALDASLAAQGACEEMPDRQAATENPSPLAVPRERIASAAQASYQNAGVVSTDSTVVRPVKTKKKRSEIIGAQLLSVRCNGRNYIRLGRLLDVDLCAFAGSALRDFYDGYGERVSYVIVLGDNLRYCKQMRCAQKKKGETSLVYFTHARIVRDLVKFTKGFLSAHLDFHAHPAFNGWPANATIDNFALVELRKISRASVEIAYQYCPSN